MIDPRAKWILFSWVTPVLAPTAPKIPNPSCPMNTRRFIHCVALLVLLALTGPALHLPAKSSEWQDAQGTAFKGEPTEVVGPFALFKTGFGTGRRMPLRGMSAEDCLRFYEEASRRPARAEKWSAAKAVATNELIGRVLRCQGKDLVPAVLSDIPEPQLLLVLYGSHNEGEGWAMLDSLLPIDSQIQKSYPDVLQTVFMGVRHSEKEHRRIVTEKQLPWLIAEFREEANMSLLSRFSPGEGTNMVLLSRNGVPLLSGQASDAAETKKFTDQLLNFMALINPANPQTWQDRAHYLSVTRPKEFAQSATGPLLVGNPLRTAGLRQRGIERIVATLAVATDGTVTPTILTEKSVIPPAMIAPLTDALRQAVVLPAIDHGTAVAGTLDYTLEAPADIH